MAAGQRYDDHRYDHRYDRHDDRRDERRAYRDGRRDERRDYRRWQRGQRLDARYRDNRYYVSDWRRHGLRAPPAATAGSASTTATSWPPSPPA